MTRVRKILITALLVLTANSAALLAGCDRRQSLGYASVGYGWSGGSYPRSTSYRPTQLYSPPRTVYIGTGIPYYTGTISYTRIQSYPKVYRPIVIRRDSRYSGRRSAPTGHTTHHPSSGHSTGHGSSGHSSGSRGHR